MKKLIASLIVAAGTTAIVAGAAGTAAAETRIPLKTGLTSEWDCAQWIMNNGLPGNTYDCQNAHGSWAAILVAP
ncbi:hypothetical protein ACWDTG_22120 [Rhodococcus zopfii]|uniref:hypothetical protein n=1 Tax=Rhodococcus zopfii TaxID=43772 RepID=UPI00111156DA|nr:hypothetical protein [Rhodococcus zopfii]